MNQNQKKESCCKIFFKRIRFGIRRFVTGVFAFIRSMPKFFRTDTNVAPVLNARFLEDKVINKQRLKKKYQALSLQINPSWNRKNNKELIEKLELIEESLQVYLTKNTQEIVLDYLGPESQFYQLYKTFRPFEKEERFLHANISKAGFLSALQEIILGPGKVRTLNFKS